MSTRAGTREVKGTHERTATTARGSGGVRTEPNGTLIQHLNRSDWQAQGDFSEVREGEWSCYRPRTTNS